MAFLWNIIEDYCYEIAFMGVGFIFGIGITVIISMIGETIEFRRSLKRDKMRLCTGQKTSHMTQESPPWNQNEGLEGEPNDE